MGRKRPEFPRHRQIIVYLNDLEDEQIRDLAHTNSMPLSVMARHLMGLGVIAMTTPKKGSTTDE